MHRIALNEQISKYRSVTFFRWVRSLTLWFITGVWLAQSAYVTIFAVDDPLILEDVEKFIGLIGVTGLVATNLVGKLWLDSNGG